MSSDTNRAARRVMDQLGEGNRIPFINVAEGDVGVLFGFPIAGLFLASLTGVDILVLPAALLGLTIGVAVVYAAPNQLTAWMWLQDVLRYYLTRPRVTLNHSADSDHEPTEGGYVQYTPFTPDERTQDLTNIERAWPGMGAIERTDGRMAAFVEIHPSNMDFAMSGDWATVQEAASEFANKEAKFPLTFYATTRSFPAEQLVDQLDDRLTNPDVKANPAFEKLLEEYRNQRPDDFAGTQQLHYYLGIEVSSIDVYGRYEQEGTPGEKLTEIPILGTLLNPFVARESGLDEHELRKAMIDELDTRIRTIRSEFIENVPGWSATRLSTLELFLLNMDFWNGEEHDVETATAVLRKEPAVGRSEREDDN